MLDKYFQANIEDNVVMATVERVIMVSTIGAETSGQDVLMSVLEQQQQRQGLYQRR